MHVKWFFHTLVMGITWLTLVHVNAKPNGTNCVLNLYCSFASWQWKWIDDGDGDKNENAAVPMPIWLSDIHDYS